MSPSTLTAVKISGQAELQYAKREAVDVPGQEGHMLALGEVRGTNKNTSTTDYFADAQVVNAETADLTQGNGTHQGYYTMRKGGDGVIAKWQGTVTTVIGPNQQPRTTFKGTWEYAKGTGAYQGIQGRGNYDGEFVAEDRYVVRWQGEYEK
jgi:hypothetical protein